MPIISIIALISGVLGVWLTIKQNIWCWPMALISVFTSSIEFFEQRLFGDMALQVIYFVAGIYGWYYWAKQKREVFLITRINPQYWSALLLITVFQSIVYYFLLSQWKGDKALWDSILTACSLTATYMMTKKWLENWFVWVIIDSAYVLLYFSKGMWLFALLYGIFAIVAFYGWRKWKTII